jgi:hypothetical protein
MFSYFYDQKSLLNSSNWIPSQFKEKFEGQFHW